MGLGGAHRVESRRGCPASSESAPIYPIAPKVINNSERTRPCLPKRHLPRTTAYATENSSQTAMELGNQARWQPHEQGSKRPGIQNTTPGMLLPDDWSWL